jgi:hypothetical protein
MNQRTHDGWRKMIEGISLQELHCVIARSGTLLGPHSPIAIFGARHNSADQDNT